MPQEFGSRFKDVLRRHNITQSKFGDDTNTHKGLISRYINGESPSGDFIMKVVAYFPDEIEYLFFGKKDVVLGESSSENEKSPEEIFNDIEDNLKKLKHILTQK